MIAPMKSPHLSTGSTLLGFEVTKSIELPELKAQLIELTHVKSGAKVLHIANDDTENLFCLSFQTLPSSSNGVAHILEHTVLCGSKKFPIKDPFFAMGRRSLNTFMNALTGSDFTCYPAATQNEKDFYNLLEVYLDAVFHPELKELSFRQEGHRLEYETPSDPSSPLMYKGIVYNEMKGALNSSAARMHEALNQALFPSITYGVNSGGDPANIPELTYEELLDFHKTYYNPSRCLFFFYGNLPLEKHLQFITDHALKDLPKAAPLPPIPLQPRFKEPQYIYTYYPATSEDLQKEKSLVSIGWVTCKADDQETCLALDVLEAVLLDTDASPLKKALLKSRLCRQVSSYLDTELHEVPFVINLKGCESKDFNQFEPLILDTLKQIVKDGISDQAVENVIQQEEFHRSEISGDHYPFGLSLFMRSALVKQHGGAPEHGLLVHSLFDQLRKRIAENPRYLTDLIQKYFIDNPHRVVISMEPSVQLEKEESDAEQRRIEEIERHLTAEERQNIVQQAENLKQFQQMQEKADIDLLPKVTLEDAAQSVQTFPLIKETMGNARLFCHPCFTNEIGYADISFDLPPLTEEELPLVRLLGVIFSQMGTKSKSYEALLEEIQAHTGGISTYLTLHVQASNENHFFPAFGLKGKALYRKLDKLFPLMRELITEVCFNDRVRLKEVLHKHLSGLESNFNQSAIRYATSLSASCQSLPGLISESWYGLHYLEALRKMEREFDKSDLPEQLQSLAARILGQKEAHLVLSLDNEMYEKLKKERFYGLVDLPLDTHIPWTCDYKLPNVQDQARCISSPVAFISRVFKTVPYVHPDAPALRASSHILENVILHKLIREEGGAYGGGAVSNGLSGNFYFYSYRDPKIADTLKAFQIAIEAIAAGAFDLDDLEEAKFEMIQDFDAPIPPGSRGETAYSWMASGITDEIRQNFRNRLLALTKEDIINACKKQIATHYPQGTTIVFGGKALIERENLKLSPPLPIITL